MKILISIFVYPYLLDFEYSIENDPGTYLWRTDCIDMQHSCTHRSTLRLSASLLGIKSIDFMSHEVSVSCQCRSNAAL